MNANQNHSPQIHGKPGQVSQMSADQDKEQNLTTDKHG
jgi:hypothetical protein